jgi:hypothetical protein
MAVSIALLIGMFASDAAAQAWTPLENSLSTSFSYTYSFADRNALRVPDPSLQGGATNHNLTLGVEYGTPVEGLAVDVRLPFVGIKVNDNSVGTHPPVAGDWDDGKFHMAPTDLRAGLRYQILNDPVALTASVAGSVPTWDYPTVGFGAPGRQLKALHLSLAAGYLPDFVPDLYVHARYEFTMPESFETYEPETSTINQNRSDASLQIGYFATGDLELNLAGDLRRSHGGVNFEDLGMYTPTTREFHDGLLNEDLLVLGGGASYQLSDRYRLGAAVRFFTTGRNTRKANIYSLFLDVALF